MASKVPMTSAERVAKRRAVLRAQGLRPRTFWLPDTRATAFREKAQRSCEWLWDRLSDDEQAMAWIEAMTEDVLADVDRRDAELARPPIA